MKLEMWPGLDYQRPSMPLKFFLISLWVQTNFMWGVAQSDLQVKSSLQTQWKMDWREINKEDYSSPDKRYWEPE